MGSSNQQYFNAGASDSALAVVNSQGVTTARDNGIALGNQAKLNTGIEIGPTNNSTFTIGETGLGEKFAQTVKDINDANNASLSQLLQNQTRSNLPAATDLPAPGDDVPADKPKSDWLFWGAILAGLGLLFWIFKR